ncbi:MAG: potassium transporter TrkG [Candidatus ainarchaeum sp.]|nr:potassium transporter TrkG [Candidatus ainarchaeum sp.]
MLLRVGKEDIKVSLKLSGEVLFYASLIFIVGIIFAIIGDKSYLSLFGFFTAGLLTFITGFILKKIQTKKEIEQKHSLFAIVIIWLAFCFFASLPFVIISNFSFIDAYFDTMSSLTTTGLTVMQPFLDTMPISLIFWRSFVGWIGGIGIVLIALIGLMTTYQTTTKLISAEGRGDQLKENLKNAGTKIALIYIGLTIIGIILLMFCGQNLWQATNYTMSAISTNGMDITTAGLTEINNGWNPVGIHNYFVDLALVFIMVMGSISFSLYYMVLKKRNLFLFIRDPEFKVLIFLGITGTILLSLKMNLFDSFFYTFSFFTCGGLTYYSTLQLANFDEFIKLILILLVIVGGCAGSTSGGIKISRAIIFLKGIFWKIKSVLLPQNAFFKKTFDGQSISNDQIKEINQFILLWIIFLIISTAIIVFHGYTMVDSIFEVASAQSNSGLSVGILSIDSPVLIKLTLIFNMFIGRLEIIPIIATIGLILSLKKKV